MRTQRDCASHRSGRKKQLGITMIEAMFGMAVLAVATVAGVIAFGEVSARQEANRLLTGMQSFNVDARLYLDTFHDNTLGGVYVNMGWGVTTEPTTTVNVGPRCTGTDTPYVGCTGSGTPSTLNISNPNIARILTFPSLSYGDSDGDNTDDLHLAFGQNDSIRVAMVISPTVVGDMITVGMAPSGTTEWGGCTFRGAAATTPNPIAFALQLALEDEDVCGHMNNTVGRYDHVQNAKCEGPSGATNWPDGKDAALNVCYAVTK